MSCPNRLRAGSAVRAIVLTGIVLSCATISAQQFVSGSSTGVPEWPARMAAGDLDEDGFADVVVCSTGSPTGTGPPPEFFAILFGDGGGGFGSSFQLLGGERPYAPEIVDFDGDGHLDIISCDFGDFFGAGPDSVYVYLGDGAGSFGTPLIVQPGDKVVAVAVEDYDGDAFLDFAVACGGSASVVVYFGDGVGGVDSELTIPLDDSPSDLAAADVDEDGIPDLVATYSGDPLNGDGTQIAVLLGDGLGGFGLPTPYEVNGGPNALGIADFDEDGHLDVAVANFGGLLAANNLVSLVFGDGLGGFSAPIAITVPDGPYDLLAEDLDADGHVDLAVSIFGEFFTQTGDTVLFLKGAGNGTFPTTETYTITGGLSGLARADLDGDLDLDLVVGNATQDTVHTLLNTAGGGGDDLFVRGDCNDDGLFDIGDPIFQLGELFSGGGPAVCDDACDMNDDGQKNIGDPIYALGALFSGGPSPLPPFPGCGSDPTDDPLGCGSHAGCP